MTTFDVISHPFVVQDHVSVATTGVQLADVVQYKFVFAPQVVALQVDTQFPLPSHSLLVPHEFHEGYAAFLHRAFHAPDI